MSDNLKRYRAIKERLFQLYPQTPSGHLAQRLQVLAMFINGIVASKRTHLHEVAAIRETVERETLTKAEAALQTYLVKGAPLGHEEEVREFLSSRKQNSQDKRV